MGRDSDGAYNFFYLDAVRAFYLFYLIVSLLVTQLNSVFKSDFLTTQGGNHGLELLQTVAHTWGTATKPDRTGPIWFSGPQRPAWISLNCYFHSE